MFTDIPDFVLNLFSKQVDMGDMSTNDYRAYHWPLGLSRRSHPDNLPEFIWNESGVVQHGNLLFVPQMFQGHPLWVDFTNLVAMTYHCHSKPRIRGFFFGANQAMSVEKIDFLLEKTAQTLDTLRHIDCQKNIVHQRKLYQFAHALAEAGVGLMAYRTHFPGKMTFSIFRNDKDIRNITTLLKEYRFSVSINNSIIQQSAS